ncbi:MAG TPA: hypothetical protein VNN80_34520 [Polyangiaceae bacterium]|nr:hypothetical protein [Polyangiaceae bacterium]
MLAATRSPQVVWAGFCVLLSPLAGCSGLAQGNETFECVQAGNCDVLASPLEEARWSCLDQGAGSGATTAPDTGMVNYDLPIVDYISQDPASDLRIERCTKPDTSCSSGTQVTVGPRNAGADVSVALERGFGRNNYLKVTSTNVGATPLPVDLDGNGMNDPDIYIPYAYYFGDTVYGERRVEPDFQLLRISDVLRLAGGAGLTVNLTDFTRTLLIVRAYDCNDDPAPNVKFRLETAADENGSPAQPFTVRGGLPFPPPTVDDFLPTDADGQGGFANVPVGNVQVFATVNDRPIGPVAGETGTAAPLQITTIEVHANRYGRN